MKWAEKCKSEWKFSRTKYSTNLIHCRLENLMGATTRYFVQRLEVTKSYAYEAWTQPMQGWLNTDVNTLTKIFFTYLFFRFRRFCLSKLAWQDLAILDCKWYIVWVVFKFPQQPPFTTTFLYSCFVIRPVTLKTTPILNNFYWSYFNFTTDKTFCYCSLSHTCSCSLLAFAYTSKSRKDNCL